MVAVVPIVINVGATVLPAVLGALGSLAALVLKPGLALPLLRRRWRWALAIAGILAVVIFLAVRAQRSGAATRSAGHSGPRTAARIDWAKVAEDLIAGERTHPAAALAARPSVTSVVSSNGGAVVPEIASPANLSLQWRFQPEDAVFLGAPALSGKRVFAAACQTDLGGYSGLLACLDFDTGTPIWQVTEAGGEPLRGFFSSPATTPDGKYVVIGQGLHQDRNCSLLCFEADTGRLHWAVKSALHIESSPAIFGDMAVVGAGAIEGNDGRAVGDPGYVFAVRISDGKELWRQAVNDPESSPAVDEAGTVYIGSGFNGNAVVAIRSDSVDDLRTRQLDRLAWKTSVGQPVTAPVKLVGELVIVGGGNSDMVHSDRNAEGLVAALNRRTGAIVWKTPFADSVLGGIASLDGKLLVPLRTGEVAALDLADGHVLWKSRVSGNAPVLAGAALTRDRAYAISNDGYLAAFALATGQVVEKVYLNDQKKPGTGLCISPPQVIGNRILVGSETGGLRLLVGTEGAK